MACMAGTTGLEPAASAVTANINYIFQKLTTRLVLPKYAEVPKDNEDCGFGCGLGERNSVSISLIRASTNVRHRRFRSRLAWKQF